MKIQQVRYCDECPFLRTSDSADSAPRYRCVGVVPLREVPAISDVRPPEWCPLRAGDYHIRLLEVS